jgi:hypothetical protein
VGGVEAGPQGVAADRWRVAHVEHRDVGWLGEEGHVGVPQIGLGRAVGGVLDPLQGLVDPPGRGDRVHVGRAERRRERDVLRVGES